MNPLISLIIPVYNVEKYFGKCIESVLAQTYDNFEVILVDDGSTDSSGRMCDEYAEKDGRVHVFHLKNGGVSRARNRGIDEAKGEFISFIDADDWVDSEYLQKLITAQKRYDADWTVCIFSNVINGKKKERTVFEKEVNLKKEQLAVEVIPKTLFNGTKQILGNPVCKLYKKELLKKHHIRFSENLKLHEDRLFNYHYAQYIDSFFYWPESLYNRTFRLDSAMHVFRKDMLDQYRAVCNEYTQLLRRFPLQDEYVFINYNKAILLDGVLMKSWLFHASNCMSQKDRWREYYKFLSDAPMCTLWKTVKVSECRNVKEAFKILCVKYRLTYLLEIEYKLKEKKESI